MNQQPAPLESLTTLREQILARCNEEELRTLCADTIRKSKTDQDRHGLKKVIPYLDGDLDPASALRDWLKAADITSGPIFRKVKKSGVAGANRLTDQVVADVVKGAAESAGLEPAQFAGHSLRSGFITSAAMSGASEWQIQEVSGHKSEHVLRGYIRDLGAGGQDAIKKAFGKVE